MKRVLVRSFLASSLLVGSSLFAMAQAAEVPIGPIKPDVKAGEKLYNEGDPARGIVACMTCHGAGGNSDLPVNPNLAAQPHEYIYKQLTEFQPKEDGMAPRRGPDGSPSVMTALATPLTIDDMRNLALYIAEQQLTKPATASNEALVARGEEIWRGGIKETKVPACAACHGANGEGIPSQYPRLSGQFASYLEQQLILFRAGHRGNNQMMIQIAARMSDADIKAVADYAAGLR
ncbi:c-type cytochrome [Orrella daihaiensis]|uniref:Cytochrome c4 n=1 Tax=Orrella daihaiensis TaxID=2782176 RepID=A0ABY4AJL3_9BURK|nr:c-type cytochrome [Orrella daihaiensis]UOD50472.1 cytochrome c4 [Orrella daihaiensis]